MKRLTFSSVAGIGALAAVLAVAGYYYYTTAILPELDPSRIPDNEAAVAAAMREYVRAQKAFSEGNYAAVPGNVSPRLGDNAYADNFRNLYYGRREDGGRLELVAREFANAHLGETNGALTVPVESEKDMRRVPYAGYLFLEDLSGDLRASAYGERFALMALPNEPHRTGTTVFWIDNEGALFARDIHPGVKTLEDLILRFLGVGNSTPAGGVAGPAWMRRE